VRWATRSRCHVDRAACAWLILRFVDQDATFVFVEDAADVPDDATPFDIRGAKLSHRGGSCSFETFLKEYDLDDDALDAIARIVHEADIGDERYDAPEAPGLDVLIRGLSLTLDDEELIRVAGRLFDGLYEYRRRANELGRIPA
jgi:hypothetical protein